jgi:hypothetical protein
MRGISSANTKALRGTDTKKNKRYIITAEKQQNLFDLSMDLDLFFPGINLSLVKKLKNSIAFNYI